MAAERALVTGVTQGLGAHLATRLAEDGWEVVGVGRRPPAEAQVPPGVDYVRLDLAADDAVDVLADRLGGVPDLIVHNAVSYPASTAGTPSAADLDTVFRANALAPYRLTHRLLADKPADQFCCCVVVNSESIFHADAQSGVYAASKAALRVLTTALAHSCRSANACVATLLLGPLADNKAEELRRVAAKRGVTEQEMTGLFLRKSNPDLVIDSLIDFESCYRTLTYIAGLGPVGNGMLCRLDGGSAGSLA